MQMVNLYRNERCDMHTNLTVQTGQSVITNRSNYGYVLSKRHELQLITASVKLVFHTTLPYRLPTVRIESVNCSTLEAVQWVSHSSRIRHMIAACQASKERLARHVKTQLYHIHDIFSGLTNTTSTEAWIFDRRVV